MKSIAAGIAAVLVIIALAVGIWNGYWWLAEDSTDRQAEINQDTYQRQNALAEELDDTVAELADVDVQISSADDPEVESALTAQRSAMADQACSMASRLSGSVPVSPASDSFIAQEC